MQADQASATKHIKQHLSITFIIAYIDKNERIGIVAAINSCKRIGARRAKKALRQLDKLPYAKQL